LAGSKSIPDCVDDTFLPKEKDLAVFPVWELVNSVFDSFDKVPKNADYIFEVTTNANSTTHQIDASLQGTLDS
jgi:hypothetical protein